MDEFNKIIKLAENDTVELGAGFKELLHKELCLGMTRYVCRYGTLSDGHEKLTDSQRYYQSIKEMYSRALAIRDLKANAMEAQADYLDAKDELEKAKKQSDRLRAEAKVMRSHDRIVSALVQTEDSLRQLDEFNKVRLELKDKVQAQYPHGIEQAEEDNWKEVARYRAAKKNLGYAGELTHVPLAPRVKAELGMELGKPELAAWLAITDQKQLAQLVEQKQELLDVAVR